METSELLTIGGLALAAWWLWGRTGTSGASGSQSVSGTSTIPATQYKADVSAPAVYASPLAARQAVRKILDSLDTATEKQFAMSNAGLSDVTVVSAWVYPADPPYPFGTYKILPPGGVRVALAQARSAAE